MPLDVGALPPGPRLPRILQVFNWVVRPLPFMEACARTYGGCFTIGFPAIPGSRGVRRPTFVFFSDPDGNKWAVQQITPRGDVEG